MDESGFLEIMFVCTSFFKEVIGSKVEMKSSMTGKFSIKWERFWHWVFSSFQDGMAITVDVLTVLHKHVGL